MIYIQYLLLAIISVPLTVLGIVLAPVLPLFADNQGWLPRWLWWLQTPDNSLDGDNGWKTEHWQWRYRLPISLSTYIGRVGWLLRNPAYAFGARYINGNDTVTYTGDTAIGDNNTAREGWLFVHASGLFQFTYVKRIFNTNKCIYVNLGWNIRALVDANNRRNNYEATFVFSPRISGFYQ